ncbi:hypothetical protein FRUB_09029 [Fimbriiglobus ruber]|uniref:Uncharacterized protein n=2 Tax=Fimbriiglobus ruber TaxID=1908690 RepID=A0A225DGH9_9BACT|nr:hypothetical protein FRUB_09029 [Fimbriiglobus ruber]
MIPITPDDLGREVVCPISYRLVSVPAAGVAFRTADTPDPRKRRFALFAAVLVVVLALCSGVGLLVVVWAPGADRSAPPVAGDSGRDVAVRPAGLEGETGPRTAVVSPITPVAPAAPVVPPGKTGVPPEATAPGREPPPQAAALTPAPTPSVVPPAPPAVAPPRPDPAPETVPPPVPPKRPQQRKLISRLDLRTTAELEAELLKVREVGLDTAAAPNTTVGLVKTAAAAAARGGIYAGPIVLSKVRADLAELPFRVGPATVLNRDAAVTLGGLSQSFRHGLGRCYAADDPRPDPAKVRALLLGDPEGASEWTVPAAVPCLRQMLPGEVAAVRGTACEAYRRTPGPAALDALVAAAVFDTDFDNRAAAVDALADRDPADVTVRLAALLDYPWVPAVEHVIEALVALNLRPAAAVVAANLTQVSAELLSVNAGGTAHAVRREMVRTNHARNCLLCHAPSFAAGDFVRGAVPDPTRPLAAGPAGYSGGAQFFARADVTYLRQDFSVVQPVPAPGPWPAHQRFDYLVALRSARAGESKPDDAGRATALRFALEKLGGDGGRADGPVAEVRSFVGETARMVSVRLTPEPTVRLYFAEFGKPLLALGDDELSVVLGLFRKRYGEAGRYALIAYLEPLRTSGTAAEQATAAALLARLGSAADWALPLTPDERAGAGRLATTGSGPIRAAAGELLLTDLEAPRRFPKEFLAILTGPDAALRAAAAEALGRQPYLEPDFYIALARAARDDVQSVREAAAAALVTLKRVPKVAEPELATSYLARREWDTPDAARKFRAGVFELLAGLAPAGETWFELLAAAATGGTPTDVPAGEVARLMGMHRDVPAKSFADLVALLTHKDYGAAATALLLARPRQANGPLVDGLKATQPSARAAAATLLGKTAALNSSDPLARDQWRTAQDALSAVAVTDPDGDVKRAAEAALKVLTKGR